MNLGSLSQPPEAPPLPTASPWSDINETGAQLLELHTGTGVVYVRPSRWQRIRLQWVFRHFHELALQVLSRRDQRLIEKLFQSAVVTPASPAWPEPPSLEWSRTCIRGNPRASAARVVTHATAGQPQQNHSALRMPWTPALLSPDFSQRRKEKEIKQIFGTAKSRNVRDFPFRQWGAVGALAASCATVIVASFFGILPLPPLVQGTAPVNYMHRAVPGPGASFQQHQTTSCDRAGSRCAANIGNYPETEASGRAVVTEPVCSTTSLPP